MQYPVLCCPITEWFLLFQVLFIDCVELQNLGSVYINICGSTGAKNEWSLYKSRDRDQNPKADGRVLGEMKALKMLCSTTGSLWGRKKLQLLITCS